MKKHISAILTSFFLAGVLLFTACDNLFEQPQIGTAAAPGTGVVEVVFQAGGAKNIVPSISFDFYEFNFKVNGVTTLSETKASSEPFLFTLPEGEYTLEVKTYNGDVGEASLAATGTSAGSFRVGPGGTDGPVEIILTGHISSDSFGDFFYEIHFPEGAGIDELQLGSFDLLSTGEHSLTSTSVSGAVHVPTGYHILTVNLLLAGKETGLAEVIEIYRNSVTYFGTPGEEPVEFEEDYFVTPPSYPLTGITLKYKEGGAIVPAALNLTVGVTGVELIAAKTPSFAEDTITWLSSNPNIVTVTNGVLYAKDDGTATITARSGNIFDSVEVTAVYPANTGTNGVPVTSYEGFQIDVKEPGDAVFLSSYGTGPGLKNNVLKITPPANGDNYPWGPVKLDLSQYAEEEIRVTISVDVHGGSTGTHRVHWKVTEVGDKYTTIADSGTTNIAIGTAAPTAANGWTTVRNTTAVIVTPKADAPWLYLERNDSTDDKGLGKRILYLSNLTYTITSARVGATGVTLNKTALTVNAGTIDSTLIATVSPDSATNKNVIWVSNDPEVATVNTAGQVTGIKTGTATITVTTVDGSFSASAAVTVIPAETVNPVTEAPNKWHGLAIADNTETQGVTATKLSSYTATSPATGTGALLATYADVLRVEKPANLTYAWGPLSYDLSEYRGQSVSINISYKVLVPVNNTKVFWQAQAANDAYPTIDGSYGQQRSPANRWIAVSNTSTITVRDAEAPQLYLESGSGGLNGATVYFADFALSINGTPIPIGPKVDVTSVTLSPSTPEILELSTEAPNNTATLTATVAPSNASKKGLIWTSSDPAVASITGTGNTVTITALRGGTAVITAKSNDSDVNVSANRNVNVTAPALESFSLQAIPTLTVGDNARIALTTVPPGAAVPSTISWSSTNNNVARVSAKGNVLATGYSDSATGLGTANITASATVNGKVITSEPLEVHTTIFSTVNLSTKEAFYTSIQRYLGTGVEIGNVFTGGVNSISSVITGNFNAFTPENDMKPGQYSWNGSAATGSASVSSTASNAASTSRKVYGHTLLWHNKTQIAKWMRDQVVFSEAEQDANRADNTRRMEKYITDVVTSFKGKVVAWDVINEAISGGGTPYTSHLRGNIRYSSQEDLDKYHNGEATFGTDDNSPWYTAVGPDYIYLAFKAARRAAIANGEPNLKLYANDYNLDTEGGRCDTYVDMITKINERWLTDPDNTTGSTKLIDGIGMQAHFNTENFNGTTFKNNLKKFADRGIEIVITELDATTTGYRDWTALRVTYSDGNQVHVYENTTTDLTGTAELERLQNEAKSPARYLRQAQIYAEAFQAFNQYKSVIKRITFWGLQDSASWRKESYPLPFDGTAQTPRVKPAYYAIIDPERISNPAAWLSNNQ
ncbi:endo-1,4-beta-xylanase [Leadbettera azotonutricia]|uniref:endo-1,4-beta-xylanase n=1 Tax=Leadbettera azotonutricia (strain ATCC BAA-888 / DSM 13862 / ZAS-9) TaxID=545695 RepID=F5YDQ0_LEAAZ|nr:endo-1,4-beta-xylanase [Leadbettera azotonutricia]AEF81589.1 putative lipoprotein [Leadbettera azotonutricia ZAS-9]